MNEIRILKASSFYLHVINTLYKNDSELFLKPYSEQYRKTMDTHFSWADNWKAVFENFGDYKVEEIIINNEILQKKWAEENHIKYDQENWLLDILEAQILVFQPDILFAEDYDYIHSGFLKQIKNRCPRIKLTIGWDGTSLNDKELFSQCDLILSCVPSVCDFYRKNGFKSYYMHFFFDPRILFKLIPRARIHDFSFIGSLSPCNGFYNQRIKMVKELVTLFPLKVWSPDPPEHGIFYKYPQRQRIWNGKFKEFWQIYKLGKAWHGNAFGLEMYQIFADSKITFNCHGDIVTEYAANIRLWEATGVGTCLITDWKENLKEFFEIDYEIVTYKTISECKEKVKYLLKNDGVREKIAIAGQNKTLEFFSAEKVLRRFDNYLKNQVL